MREPLALDVRQRSVSRVLFVVAVLAASGCGTQQEVREVAVADATSSSTVVPSMIVGNIRLMASTQCSWAPPPPGMGIAPCPDAGSPQAGTLLRVGSREVALAPNGDFRMPHPGPGEHRVEVAHRDGRSVGGVVVVQEATDLLLLRVAHGWDSLEAEGRSTRAADDAHTTSTTLSESPHGTNIWGHPIKESPCPTSRPDVCQSRP